MIEVPRGALRAGDLANHAEFFSFGTNDLTQVGAGAAVDQRLISVCPGFDRHQTSSRWSWDRLSLSPPTKTALSSTSLSLPGPHSSRSPSLALAPSLCRR